MELLQCQATTNSFDYIQRMYIYILLFCINIAHSSFVIVYYH